jgi:hypothetical protein
VLCFAADGPSSLSPMTCKHVEGVEWGGDLGRVSEVRICAGQDREPVQGVGHGRKLAGVNRRCDLHPEGH